MSARCSVTIAFDAHALARDQRRARASICAASTLADTRVVDRFERLVDACATKSWRRSATTQPSALVRPGPRRDQDLRNRQLARQRRRMQRPGAAEGEEREVARVVAARQARPCGWRRPCGRWRRARSPRRPAVGVEPERRADLLGEAVTNRSHRDGVLDSEEPLRIEPAEHQIGIGDGRPRAAAAVADRPRRRRRRSPARPCSMPDASTEAIEPPPAPIGVDVDHRHVDRHRVFELEVARDRRHAGEHQRNVARGAAHVVGDDVAELAGSAPACIAVAAAAMTPEAGPDITVCDRRARRRSATTPCRRCPASPAARARSRAPRSSACSRSM